MKWLAILLLSLTIITGAFAGASGGPRSLSYNLGAGEKKVFSIAFDKYSKDDTNSLAQIAIQQTTASTLQIIVRSSDAVPVADATGNGSFLCTDWRPDSNQIYTVTVYNNLKDAVPAVFTITTN